MPGANLSDASLSPPVNKTNNAQTVNHTKCDCTNDLI